MTKVVCFKCKDLYSDCRCPMVVEESQEIVKDIRITVPKFATMVASVNGHVKFQMAGIDVQTQTPKELVKFLRDLQNACQVMISKVEA